MSQRWPSAWKNSIIVITSKMVDPATPYLHIMCLVPEYFMRFEPKTPQYKKLKNGMITSMALRITDQNNNIITNGPGTTVVLRIQ